MVDAHDFQAFTSHSHTTQLCTGYEKFRKKLLRPLYEHFVLNYEYIYEQFSNYSVGK